jgi:hypothetical protein
MYNMNGKKMNINSLVYIEHIPFKVISLNDGNTIDLKFKGVVLKDIPLGDIVNEESLSLSESVFYLTQNHPLIDALIDLYEHGIEEMIITCSKN